MALENPIVKQMYDELMSIKPQAPTYTIEARVLANGEDMFIPKINGITEDRNYMDAIASVTMLDCAIPFTRYRDLIHPNLEELEIEIKYIIKTQKGQHAKAPEFFIRKYKAIVTDPMDVGKVQVERDNKYDDYSNMGKWSRIVFQLTDINMYEMQFDQVGGFYPNCTVEDLIKVHLSHRLTDNEKKKGLTNKDFSKVRGVSMYPADNKDKRLIMLKGYTKVVDIPFILQDGNYGVYNSGLGAFYQANYTMDNYYHTVKGGLWFVYPLFNFKRFETEERTLTVFMAPEVEFSDMDNTFDFYSKQVRIFATGKKMTADKSDNAFYNDGNGIVFGRSSEIIDNNVLTEGNRVFPDAKQTRRSFITRERKDGFNDVKPIDGFYTENPYKHASKLASSNIQVVSCQWANSMPDLLYPGMPTKILNLVGKELVESMGTLIGVYTKLVNDNSSPTDPTFVSNCVLTFAVEPRK